MPMADPRVRDRHDFHLCHASRVLPGSYSPLAAQQFFGAGTISNGILALLSVIGVSFLGAVLGGMCGRIYHRRVEKYPK